MSVLVSESQVAEALDIGQKAVRLRAVKNDWISVKKKKQGGAEHFFVRDLLPVDVRKHIIDRQSVGGNTPVPAVIHDTPIPKKSAKIGMAKYNLVHAFRVAKEQAPWGRKREAVETFLLSYNAGVLLPQIHNVLGDIQERTLDGLDKKLRDHDDNYLCLCDGRGGWKKHGTTKYKGRKLSEPAKAVFLKCYLHSGRPSVAMAIRAARMTLRKQGMPEPADDSTFRRWLKDYEKYNAAVICLAREGMKAYQDRYAPYITRDGGLLDVGQCLVADGKTLNFFIRHPDTGRPVRMTLIVFFDWASRYPVGWQIMPTENQWGILAAFRNAVVTLGRYPDSVYLDNGRAFKSKLFTDGFDLEESAGLYARVGTAAIFAKPYNGRAKVVERFFGTMQIQLESILPTFCGDSIQTKPAHAHRNEKFHKGMHEAKTHGWIPSIRDAAIIIEAYFQWYGRQPHADLPATPLDMFLPHRGPGVDPFQLNHDFLWRKTVHPRNCRVTLWGIEYESDCLHNLSRKAPIRAMVDTSDLSKIWCYTQDGLFLGEAYPVQACHPLARLFGDQVAIDQVTHENKRQARLAKSTKKQLLELGFDTGAEDSLNILPFVGKAAKTAIIPKSKPEKPRVKKLSESDVKRLEAVVCQAEAEADELPEIPRPKYWGSDLEHYEWCFRLIHEHGREPTPDDDRFMTEFESRPDFEQYRERFEDLKLIFEF